MKKFMLATTALVSIAYVGSASADVTLGGYYEFGWGSVSDDRDEDDMGGDTHTFQDSEIYFTFEKAADSGLVYGANFQLEGAADRTVSVGTDNQGTFSVMDESSLYIIGDFGKLELGQNDYASDSFQTWMPTPLGTYSQDDGHYLPRFLGPRYILRTMDHLDGNDATPADGADSVAVNAPGSDLQYYTYYAGTSLYDDSEKISYFSPDLGGFQFGASWTDGNTSDGSDEEANIGLGASYTFGGGGMDDMMMMDEDGNEVMDPRFEGRHGMMDDVSVTVTAASYSDGEEDGYESLAYGVTIGWSNVTVAYGKSSTESGNLELDATEYGIGWQVSDSLMFGVSTANSEEEFYKDEVSVGSFGFEYTVVPGLAVGAVINTFDAKTETQGTADAAGTARAATDSVNNSGSNLVLRVQANF